MQFIVICLLPTVHCCWLTKAHQVVCRKTVKLEWDAALTRRPKMTCVRDNEWWVGKAWPVGILTIWVTCVLLFAALSPHEFWKQRCKLFPFHNICRQKISKKMKDGWTKAMAMELPLGIGIHLFNTPGVQQTLLSEYISCGGFDGMGSYFHPYSYFLLLKSTTW